MYLNSFVKKLVISMVLVAFSSFSGAAQAVDPVTVEQLSVEKITAKMSALQIQVRSVTPSAIDGLYEVSTDSGIYYVSQNAQFLVHGNIYDLDNGMENLSEKSFKVLRKNRLKAFEKDMIVYKAPEEKHIITVFTDVSCGYCQKLHAEMADYHNQGITVRYLAFPRAGLKSSTYHTMVSVWCADDPKLAMDNAKKRREIEPKTCENTVKEQYELGLFFGVNGTPAIVFEDGSLKPGYVPADRLIKMLEEK